jgi:hypothetical protein
MVFSGTRNALEISVVVSPQRQRDLRLAWQRRMAARENQAQDIVLHLAVLRRVFGKPLPDPMIGDQVGFDLLALGQKADMAPQPVDRLVAADINQPGAGVCGDAFVRPLCEGRREGILHRIFRKLEITDKPNQSSQYAATLVAEQQFDLIGHSERSPRAVGPR